MKISSMPEQPVIKMVITNRSEVKSDNNKDNKDMVILGDSGTKTDDILNYKNLSAQKAFSSEGFFEDNKTAIDTVAGAVVGGGIALLVKAEPKAAVTAALLGAGAGFLGAKITIGMAIGAAAGTAVGIITGTHIGGVVGGAAGAVCGGFLATMASLSD
ncbi:MAG: hypothetical protein ABRQ38_23615 [Candidatus Eremiobacterota bacterium]